MTLLYLGRLRGMWCEGKGWQAAGGMRMACNEDDLKKK